MKKAFLFSIIVLSSKILTAQEIELSKFSLPEFKRNELIFNLSSNNSGDIVTNETKDGNDFRNSSKFSAQNSGYIQFNRYRNNKNFQGKLNAYLSFNFPNIGIASYDDPISNRENTNKDYRFVFTLNSSSRFYKLSNWYFEIDPDILLNNSFSSYYDESRWSLFPSIDSNNKRLSFQYNNSVNSDFRIGKGRVEPVEDLRQVAYILKDLQKAGRLKRDITQEDANLLAEKLSELKNRRFLDSRLRLIEEMTEIEKIMQEMDLITDNDAAFFSTVNDFWSMTPNPTRSSGKRLSFGVKPAYEFNYYKGKDSYFYVNLDSTRTINYNDKSNVYSGIISARFEKFQALNLYWQQDYNAEILAEIKGSNRKNLINDEIKSYNLFSGGITAAYSLNYFPNSRTTYSGNADFSYRNGSGNEENAGSENVKYEYSYARVGLSAEYYFSPQLSLNGSTGFVYSNTNNTTTQYYYSEFPLVTDLAVYIRLGLKYKLF
jgi:hypothetical protein